MLKVLRVNSFLLVNILFKKIYLLYYIINKDSRAATI